MPINVSFDYNFNEMPPLADGDHKIKLTSYMQNDKRRVSMPPKDCSAVEVRRLRYVVGRRKKAKVILSGINMTVPEGAIYGLLGPSGSGKTTLLKSVVGQLAPTEGWVKVFGFQPNQPGSQIPGAAIGYMPQELAVYEDFTIKETLWYFGRLYRIPGKLIKERIEFLLNFLDLPRSERLIVNMSGGQKRRVSLASALVHSPPLLILDEPTVGVDPLLRQSIWQHLVTLTQTEKITVIVTTHYIEEARRANIVGLMRRGKLLAENTPDDLMAKHNSDSLEDVFLKLCVTDTMRRTQKYANFTGMPEQMLAITGPCENHSALATPEIQNKCEHYHHHHHDHHHDHDHQPAEGFNPTIDEITTTNSIDPSQSPDEGVNTNNSSDHSSNSEGELGPMDQQESQAQQAGEASASAGDKNDASAGLAESKAPNKDSSSSSSSLSTGKQSPEDQLMNVSPNRSSLTSEGSTMPPDGQQADPAEPEPCEPRVAGDQRDDGQQQTAAARSAKGKFQLRSLLKSFNASSPSKRSSDDQPSSPDRASAEAMKAAEKRRQSGTYFIEQLMNKCNLQQQQQQQAHHLNATKPLNQMLRCDTAGATMSNGKRPHSHHYHHGHDRGSHHNNHHHLNQAAGCHLKVPKIAVHGSYGADSGASSNGSSQNHSPICCGGNVTQPEDNRASNGSNVHANLMAAAYANHSYQASECGSTAFNDLALISASAASNVKGSGAFSVVNLQQFDNSSSRTMLEHSSHQSFRRDGRQHHMVEPQEEDDDDMMLDPKLFMNPADLSTMSPGNKYDYKQQSVKEYCDTIGTITWKNYIRLKRNVPLLLFQFVLPAIQVILFCICVGNDPFDIPVAVVNEESSADSIASLSSQFLRSIDTHLVKQVNFTNLGSAIESVRSGANWGVIHIPENFTISIHKRFAGMELELDDATLENSTIKVYPDMTNQPIGHAMEVAFRRAYNDLSKQTFEFLGLNPALSDPPIRMEHAIYGKIDQQNYLQYMSPGVLISISYIMATGLTSLAFIIERRDGLYDRTLAAGVGHVQMLLSHSIVQLVVMVVQISLVVFFTFVIYKVPTNGPFIWVFLLLLLQGLAGMSFGLMVSAICKEENTAIMMILGTFYPNLLLAGVIWPIEAIPHWLRWFSYLQPQTLPTQSLRDLIVRGWDIDQPGVWTGFAVTTSWLFLFLAISCIAFRIKK